MPRWRDTLFARALLLQAGVALLVALLFGAVVLRQQARASARAAAPLWAAAVAPVLAGQAALPRVATVESRIALLAGPPPDDALEFPFNPRFRPLLSELRALGIAVRELRVSGRTGEAVTWLGVEPAGAPGAPLQWVGVRSELEGIDVRERNALGLAIALAVIATGAWSISRRVLKPVADLGQAMRRFDADGTLPSPPPASAPAELRELSEQFAAFARQRRDLDHERATMLAAISHDLRSPLARIRMAAELLPESPEVAPRREAIVRNVIVADRLLGAFIDFARTEHEAYDQRIDLAALVRDVVREMAREGARDAARDAAAAEPDVTLAPLPARPVVLPRANALALERALRNLIDNARRHGAAPVEVSLVTAAGNHAVLAVRDHGPGIAPERRALLLQPFQRGERSRQLPGTGLGLAIVQRAAERLGGRLALDDAHPGLRVELRLPIEPA